MLRKILILLIGVIFCFVFIFYSTEKIYAQEEPDIKSRLRVPDANSVQIIILTDGSKIIGRIVNIGENDIEFKSDIGVMTIPNSKIVDIREVPASSIKKGAYWFPNPNTTRLYFAPTGRMLKKGEGYFADYYIFFPMAAYGITENISIGGGFSIVPFIDFGQQIFYLTPKVGLKASESLNLAAGALLVKIPDFDNGYSPLVGIFYGVATFGKEDLSFTAGFGYGFEGGDFASKPMIMLGGEARLTRRLSFVTENWIFPGVDEPLISYGLRLFGEKLSIDLAFINILGEGSIFPGFPYIDFVFNF